MRIFAGMQNTVFATEAIFGDSKLVVAFWKTYQQSRLPDRFFNVTIVFQVKL